jgi:hypothetical protein
MTRIHRTLLSTASIIRAPTALLSTATALAHHRLRRMRSLRRLRRQAKLVMTHGTTPCLATPVRSLAAFRRSSFACATALLVRFTSHLPCACVLTWHFRWSSDVGDYIRDRGISHMTAATKAHKPFYLHLWWHMSHDTIDPRPEQCTYTLTAPPSSTHAGAGAELALTSPLRCCNGMWLLCGCGCGTACADNVTYPFKETCLFPATASCEAASGGSGCEPCNWQIFWGVQVRPCFERTIPTTSVFRSSDLLIYRDTLRTAPEQRSGRAN